MSRNVQVLVTEIFEVKNDLAADIMKDAFRLKNPYRTYGQNQITLHTEMLRLLTMISYQLSTKLHKYRNLFQKALENVRL